MSTTTETAIAPFAYEGHTVRTAEDERGEPLFCLADVGAVLGLREPTKFLKNDYCDHEGVAKFSTPSDGGPQEMVFISEANLYALVMRSSKPEARKFSRWVTHEVLPTLRKTGRYEIAGRAAAQDAPILHGALDRITGIAEGQQEQIRVMGEVMQSQQALTLQMGETLQGQQRLILQMGETLQAVMAGSLPKPAPAPEVPQAGFAQKVVENYSAAAPRVAEPDLEAIGNPRERVRAKVGRYVERAQTSFHSAWLEVWRSYDAEMGFCSRRHAERFPSRLSWCFEKGNVGVLEEVVDRLLATAQRARRK